MFRTHNKIDYHAQCYYNYNFFLNDQLGWPTFARMYLLWKILWQYQNKEGLQDHLDLSELLVVKKIGNVWATPQETLSGTKGLYLFFDTLWEQFDKCFDKKNA